MRLSSGNTGDKERAKLNDPVINLVALLDQTSDIIYQAEELEIEKYKVSLAQVKVMYIILKSENKMVSLSDISKLMLREPNSVSALITRMEKAGLVKKTRDVKDNKILVTVTPNGYDLVINKLTEESMKVIVSSLTDTEKQKLILYLKKLREKGRQVLGLDLKPPFLR